MPLTESQIQKEAEYAKHIGYMHIECIRDAHPSFGSKYKTGDKAWIKCFGSMVCWDNDGNWYSYYDIKNIISEKEKLTWDKIKKDIVW